MVSELAGPNFSHVVDATQEPVVVFFHKPGCNPCTQVAPHIRAVAEKYAGAVRVFSLNVQVYGRDVQDYSAGGSPLVVLFHEGLEVWRWRGGSTTADRISKEIDDLLKTVGDFAGPW